MGLFSRVNDPYNTMGAPAGGKPGKAGKPGAGRRKHWDEMPLPEVQAMRAEYEHLRLSHRNRASYVSGMDPYPHGASGRAAAQHARELEALRVKYDYDGPWEC